MVIILKYFLSFEVTFAPIYWIEMLYMASSI